MGLLSSIITGLLTALIGYIVGRMWQRFSDQRPYRHARRFWGPLLGEELQIVVSRFSVDSFIDPTGVVGGGDALALREISSYFAKIGLKGVSIVYVDEASLDREKNLILLGGLDTNEVTKDAFALIRPEVEIVDPGPGIPMEVHDLAPESDSQKSKGIRGHPKIIRYVAKPDIDYGIIIRARNPFNPAKVLIIFAGAYGYGTWAGVRLALQDSFLDQCEKLGPQSAETPPRNLWHRPRKYLTQAINFFNGTRSSQNWSQFECIFKVKVFDKRPHAPDVIMLRRLP